MSDALAQTLLSCGVQPSQLVDIQRFSPRALRYLDLAQGDDAWVPPIVIEHQHAPRAFVFDGRGFGDQLPEPVMEHWCRRIVLRGDPAWTVMVHPGRLDVLSFKMRGKRITPSIEASMAPDVGALARFIHDARSGTADIPQRIWLKDLLAESMKQAVDLGVSPNDAVSLIGWGLFWRFLADRNLLDSKTPDEIATGAGSWTDCLDTKLRALKTLKWLESTFNGSLLPFEVKPEHYRAEVFSRMLGNIAVGATPQGQLRLPGDWSEVNFSHIPVGLLSEVYEAFAFTLDAPAAKQKSLHYTPAHIAGFMVNESLRAIDHVAHPRILDPAVGAGVFLVEAFRALVQREWERTEVRPQRKQIRRILARQLCAFDIDVRALRLTQLSLYLTALELDPNPKPVEALRFDRLDGSLRLRDEPDGSLAAVAKQDVGQFDLVIGNPPWTKCNREARQRWESSTRNASGENIPVQRLRSVDAGNFEFPDSHPDLAFLWRSGEWAKPGGQISLVLHARWLFGQSERLVRARQQMLTAFNLTGVVNGSALRETEVWPNVRAPFCILFARNEHSPANGALQFVSPPLEANPSRKQTIVRVDWSTVHALLHTEVKSTPWLLKACFRGDPLAHRALRQLLSTGRPLGEYLNQLSPPVQFRNGYKVGGKKGKQHSAAHLHGLPDLNGSRPGDLPFLIEPDCLPKFKRKTLLSPYNKSRYAPPLLLVAQIVPANRHSPRALRANSAIAFHQSFHAISFDGVSNGQDYARWLQILLQSNIGLFLALMTDAKFGIERDMIHQESLDVIPVIPLERFTQTQLNQMRAISSEIERRYELSEAQFEGLNTFVFDMYELGALERQAIADTLQTRGPTPASIKRAMSSPTQTERDAFVASLSTSLDDILQASSRRARIEPVHVGGFPWRILSIATDQEPTPPVQLNAFLDQADRSGASLVVCPTRPHHVFVGLPDRYQYWTKTQAVLLAHELLDGALGHV